MGGLPPQWPPVGINAGIPPIGRTMTRALAGSCHALGGSIDGVGGLRGAGDTTRLEISAWLNRRK